MSRVEAASCSQIQGSGRGVNSRALTQLPSWQLGGEEQGLQMRSQPASARAHLVGAQLVAKPRRQRRPRRCIAARASRRAEAVLARPARAAGRRGPASLAARAGTIGFGVEGDSGRAAPRSAIKRGALGGGQRREPLRRGRRSAAIAGPSIWVWLRALPLAEHDAEIDRLRDQQGQPP